MPKFYQRNWGKKQHSQTFRSAFWIQNSCLLHKTMFIYSAAVKRVDSQNKGSPGPGSLSSIPILARVLYTNV